MSRLKRRIALILRRHEGLTADKRQRKNRCPPSCGVTHGTCQLEERVESFREHLVRKTVTSIA